MTGPTAMRVHGRFRALALLLALLCALAAAQNATGSSSASAAAGDTCAAEAATLSDACGDLCDAYQPCLAYNASASCASCESNASDACQYVCFETEGENVAGTTGTTYFVLLVTFGDYQSAEEIAARAEDPDYESSLALLPDNTTDYAWVSNNLLTRVDALDVSPQAAYLCVPRRSYLLRIY